MITSFSDATKSLLTSTVVLSIYLNTKFPSLPGGDAGELLSEACQLGTPHPPGYPLFTVMSHLSMQILRPFTSPANAVNILCCCLGTITSYFLIQTVNTYTRGATAIAASFAGLVFALSELTWEYSIGTEVFALNNALVALLLYLTAKIATSPSENIVRDGKMGAFVCGLALSNQHTSLLLEVILIPYAAWMLFKKNQLTVRTVLELFLSFSFGFSPYFYLIWASSCPTPGSWGDLSTFEGFWRHVSREEYGMLRLAPRKGEYEGWIERWLAYIKDVSVQFHYGGFFLALVGILCVLKEEVWVWIIHEIQAARKTNHQRRKKNKKKNSLNHPSTKSIEDTSPLASHNKFGIILLTSLLFYLTTWNGIFSNLPLKEPMARAVHSRFWMQPNIIMAIFAGLGLNFTLEFLVATQKRGSIIGLLLLILQFIVSMKNLPSLNKTQSGLLIHKYGQALLETIPHNSLLISHTDIDWNTIRYLQTCEKLRRDVTHVNVQLLPFSWFQRQITEGLYGKVVFPPILPNVSTKRGEEGNTQLVTRFLLANMNSFDGGVYLDMQAVSDVEIGDGGSFHEFTLIQWGLVYKVVPRLKLNEIPDWYKKSNQMAKKVKKIMSPYVSMSVNYSKGSWEFAAVSIYWDMHYQFGLNMLTYALTVTKLIKSKPMLFVPFLRALKESSKLLWQVEQAVQKQGTLSYPEFDALKNCALSFMRYYEASKVAREIKRELPAVPDIDMSQMNEIEARAKDVVRRFVVRYPQDRDVLVFHRFLDNLPSVEKKNDSMVDG